MEILLQGVSRGAHDVLNLAHAIEAQQSEGISNHLTLDTLPSLAVTMAYIVADANEALSQRRWDAAHAAARLLAFVDLADAELAKEAA